MLVQAVPPVSAPMAKPILSAMPSVSAAPSGAKPAVQSSSLSSSLSASLAGAVKAPLPQANAGAFGAKSLPTQTVAPAAVAASKPNFNSKPVAGPAAAATLSALAVLPAGTALGKQASPAAGDPMSVDDEEEKKVRPPRPQALAFTLTHVQDRMRCYSNMFG